MLSIDEIMAILPETVPRLAALSARLTPAALTATPAPGEWSVNDILAHLRACHDVLGGNVLRILREDHPAWRGMSPRTWQRRTDYHEWPFDRAFEAFSRQRAELLSVLAPLPPEDWERTATVAVPPAKVYEYSARYYADWMAGHERAHLKHLPRVIAAVGGPSGADNDMVDSPS